MRNTRFILILIALLVLGGACGGGTQPTQKPAATTPLPESKPATPAPTTVPVPSADAPKPNHFSLDTSRQVNQPMPENKRVTQSQKPPPAPANPKSKPPGPVGYVTQKEAVLQTEPAPNAATIAPLSQYENIYILETIFTDDQGRQAEYPTWYKVERQNKQQGWVKGKHINSGGGG